VRLLYIRGDRSPRSIAAEAGA